MGPQPELHQSPELGKRDGKLKIGLCRHLAWPSKPAQIRARFCAKGKSFRMERCSLGIAAGHLGQATRNSSDWDVIEKQLFLKQFYIANEIVEH